MTSLSLVFPHRRSGYWGTEPGRADVDVCVIRNGDVGVAGGVRWSALPVRGFSAREAERARVQKGDILLTTSGNCGNVAIVGDEPKERIAATNFVRLLRVDRSIADERYAFHFLRSTRFRSAIRPYVRGATIKNLSVEAAFEAIDMPTPRLVEQRRIAAILDRTDRLRSNADEVRRRWDDLAKSALSELLQHGFTRVPLGDLFADNPKNGLYRPRSAYGSGSPIVRIDSFAFGSPEIAWSRLKRLRASTSQIAEFGLQPGDLLVNRVNSREFVGKTALVDELSEATVFESNMMRIRVDAARIHPVYLAAFMQTADVRRQVAPMTKDAVNQSSINQTDVRNIRVPVPPINAQRDFVNLLSRINFSRSRSNLALSAHDELHSSLQFRAFRGEL